MARPRPIARASDHHRHAAEHDLLGQRGRAQDQRRSCLPARDSRRASRCPGIQPAPASERHQHHRQRRGQRCRERAPRRDPGAIEAESASGGPGIEAERRARPTTQVANAEGEEQHLAPGRARRPLADGPPSSADARPRVRHRRERPDQETAEDEAEEVVDDDRANGPKQGPRTPGRDGLGQRPGEPSAEAAESRRPRGRP